MPIGSLMAVSYLRSAFVEILSSQQPVSLVLIFEVYPLLVALLLQCGGIPPFFPVDMVLWFGNINKFPKQRLVSVFNVNCTDSWCCKICYRSNFKKTRGVGVYDSPPSEVYQQVVMMEEVRSNYRFCHISNNESPCEWSA